MILLQTIIDKVDELCPNQFSTEQKAAWLGELDGKVHREVLTQYAGGNYPKHFEGYDHADPDTPLLIDFPYGEPIYLWWLQAQIAIHNREVQGFNYCNEMFEAKYQDWLVQYGLSHKSLAASRFRI